MKKIAGALLLVTSLFAFAPAARAAVSNDELLTKLEKIEQRQEEILAELAKVREELNIVKVRVSVRG